MDELTNELQRITIITSPQHGSKIVPPQNSGKHASRIEKDVKKLAIPYQVDMGKVFELFRIFTRDAFALNENGIATLLELCARASINPTALEDVYLQTSIGGDTRICGRLPHYIVPELEIIKSVQQIGMIPPRLRVIQTTSAQLAENSVDASGQRIYEENFVKSSAIALAFVKFFVDTFYSEQSAQVKFLSLPRYGNSIRELFIALYGLLPEDLTATFKKIAVTRNAKPDAYVGRHSITYGHSSSDFVIGCGGRTELEYWRAAERMAYEFRARDGDLSAYLARMKGHFVPRDESIFIGFGIEPGYYCQRGEPDLFETVKDNREIDPVQYIGNPKKLERLRGEYQRLMGLTGDKYFEFIRHYVSQIPEEDVVGWAIKNVSDGRFSSTTEWDKYCLRIFEERLGWPSYVM